MRWLGFALALIPFAAQADTIKTVSGLADGFVQVEYTSGQITTKQIFSVDTANETIVEKVSGRAILALQADGRKLAWVNASRPKDWEIDRLKLVDGVRTTTADMGLYDFGDGDVPVIVAKRQATVDVIVADRTDGGLDIVDRSRFQNEAIVPSKTVADEEQGLIKLRNRKRAVVERAMLVGLEDPHLLQQHETVTCANQWYESHAHMEDLDALEDYIERLNDQAVGCSLLFMGVEWDNLDDTYAETVATVRMNPGRFVPFYNGDPNSIEEISVENLQAILDNDTRDLFKGIGEFAFYRDPLTNTALTSDPWPDVFQWASDNDLIIMIHLNSNQGTELDTMLDNYPTTTVLLHGRELAQAGELATLLADHPNLYFTLDTANMINVDGPLMFPVAGGGDDTVSDKTRASDFIEAYDANVTTMLSDSHTLFDELFAVAPNQVLWGTDTAFTWHTRPAVYRRLIEFTEAFDQRTGYVTTNALTLFGEGVTLP